MDIIVETRINGDQEVNIIMPNLINTQLGIVLAQTLPPTQTGGGEAFKTSPFKPACAKLQ